MRFLLYNIRYCTGVRENARLPIQLGRYLKRTAANLKLVTQFIKLQRPDVVGMLEVDGGSFRSGRQNQAEVIAEALGHYHLYESKYAEKSVARSLPVINKQVNAFLTRDAIKEKKFHYFDRGVKRLVIELELENLTIFLVHLSLKFRHRHRQLSSLYSLVKDVKKPRIVAGDFNSFWGDDEIKLFLAATGLRSANTTGLPSYPSWAPKRQLDFILHSEEISVTRFAAPHVTLSDHLPLICDFEIKK